LRKRVSVRALVYLKISADDVGKTTIPLGPFDIPTRVKAIRLPTSQRGQSYRGLDTLSRIC